jgi:hypothetical protein
MDLKARARMEPKRRRRRVLPVREPGEKRKRAFVVHPATSEGETMGLTTPSMEAVAADEPQRVPIDLW